MKYSTSVQLKPWGNSNGLRIPKEVLAILSLSPNDYVDLLIQDEELIIKKKRKTLEEKFADFDGKYPYSDDVASWSSMDRVGDELL